MSTQTKIEWCDSTFNPWIGCTKISPACDNCYAFADFDLRRHRVKWGAGQARSRTSAENWKHPLRWNNQADEFRQCDVCGWRGLRRPDRAVCPTCHNGLMQPTRRRVFCASLADWLDNEVSIEWLCDLLDLIRRCENLDFLLLTKRIGNWRSRLAEALSAEIRQNRRAGVMIGDWLNGSPPANVWLGATVCNQTDADRDIPKLLAVPAAKRFLSMEPLLGPVDLERPRPGPDLCQGGGGMICQPWLIQSGIDWVIVGGESGPNARPMHPYWVRGIRDQCAAAGVPFLFKQWGEWAPYDRSRFDGSMLATPNALDMPMQRFGKKDAGRLLDGRTWEQFP